MLRRKFFLRTIMALLIVTGLLSTALVGAEVQTFDGQGTWQTIEEDDQKIAMERAAQRAKRDAKEKIHEQIRNLVHSLNATITDDEISAVTQNIVETVGEVQFDKKIVQLNNKRKTISYTAKVKTKINLDGIFDFMKRDDKEKLQSLSKTISCKSHFATMKKLPPILLSNAMIMPQLKGTTPPFSKNLKPPTATSLPVRNLNRVTGSITPKIITARLNFTTKPLNSSRILPRRTTIAALLMKTLDNTSKPLPI